MHYDPLKFVDPAKMDSRDRRELFSTIAAIEGQQPIGSALTTQELGNLIKFLQALSF